MKFLETLKSRQAQEQAVAFDTYRDLLNKAAAAPDGALGKADDAKLAAAVEALGYDVARVQADAAALREIRTLQSAPDACASLRDESEAAHGAASEYAAETDRIMAERHTEGARLREHAAARLRAYEAAMDKAGRLAGLLREHWKLVPGTEDPAVAAKRLHLFQGLYVGENPPGATPGVDCRTLESLMGGSVPMDLAAREIVPLAGQKPDELAELVRVARVFTDGASADERHLAKYGVRPNESSHRQGWYLFPADEAGKFRHSSGRVTTPNNAISNLAAVRQSVVFVRAPGQDAEAFAKLEAKVRRAWKRLDAEPWMNPDRLAEPEVPAGTPAGVRKFWGDDNR